MMGERTVAQEALFYSFNLERHVPADHLLRSIDRFVDLSDIREHLRPYYSEMGRPSIDPELMIRMLIIGYCMGIRSERRLCEEVHLNLAYRWFCRLGLEGDVPDHPTFSKNRHGRFRDSDLLRQLFEMTVARCMAEGLIGGEGFAVDASLIRADVHRQRSVPGEDGLPPEAVGRAVREYLEVLDDAAFGGATPVTPRRDQPHRPGIALDRSHARGDLLRIQHQLSDRSRPRGDRRCRGDDLGATGRSDRPAPDDRANAAAFRHLARASRSRRRLWISPQPGLAGRGHEHRAAYPGVRQVRPERRQLRARRLRL
jgi:transposase